MLWKKNNPDLPEMFFAKVFFFSAVLKAHKVGRKKACL